MYTKVNGAVAVVVYVISNSLLKLSTSSGSAFYGFLRAKNRDFAPKKCTLLFHTHACAMTLFIYKRTSFFICLHFLT